MASAGSVGGGIGPDEGNPDSIKLAAIGKPQGAPLTNSRIARYAAGFSDTYVNSTCGAVAGAASGFVTCPLDVIKTKLQAQGSFRKRAAGMTGATPSPYRGLFGTASTVWAQEGARGFYRGLGPMMIGYLPTWAVYMGVYNKAKDYYYTQFGKKSYRFSYVPGIPNISTDQKWIAQVAASITAGGCSTLATNPIWVIKTRLMSQVGAAAAKETRTPWHYHSTMDAFRQMYRTEGMAVFYSGLAPALLGLSHVAIQFPLYEYFKFNFTGLEMGDSSTKESHWGGVLAATFLSKVCATTATYPHEVLRTRLQTQQRQPIASRKHHGPLRSHGASLPGAEASVTEELKAHLPRYKGVVSACKTILAEEGWRAFYYGMGTNLFRAVPSAMTTMFTFEMLKGMVQRMQEEGKRELAAGLDK